MDELLSGRRFLVVEDEMMVLMMIETMLTDLGCSAIAVAASVDQALALIDAQAFDAAMLDVNLNGQRSYAVADALAERSVPFFFSTGYGARGVVEPYTHHPLLKKPFQFSALEAMIRRLPFAGRTLPSAA